MKKIILIGLYIVYISNIFALSENDIESRLEILEQEIESLKEILFEAGLLDNKEHSTTNANIIDSVVEPRPITVELLSIDFFESNRDNDYANDFSDWISFVFLFTNNHNQTIRAAKGSVVFMDLFGDEWWKIGLTLNDPIGKNEAITWEGMIDYNGYIDAHKTAKRSDPSGIQVRFDIEQMLLSDGTKLIF
ncbi:MAG: hypothetical protein MI717_09805 [Spirochaetales bacterium]|nr:hypothetical protein [Spirochaetales bacterium]